MQMPQIPMNKERADQTAGGVFLIGLALLFMTGWWFPGILFVIGGSMVARSLAQGKSWLSDKGALILFAIGLLFGLPSFLGGLIVPLGLIGAGVYLLYGDRINIKLGSIDSSASSRLSNMPPVKREPRSDVEREIDRELGRNDATVTDAMDALRRESGSGTRKPKNDDLL
ncbi:MAG: hypothetical protein SGI73_15855 [Chloroflexota bacterium]|nr:hypothetical protein [Chloroflexota bacterium]